MAIYHSEMKFFTSMIDDIFQYYYSRKKKMPAIILYNNWIGQTKFQPEDDEMSEIAIEYFDTLNKMSDQLIEVLNTL